MYHFLDTSILYSILLGTKPVKEYYKNEFAGKQKYVTKYVLMEFNRGITKDLINFYNLLNMEYIKSIDEAMDVWSERFSVRGHKNLIKFLTSLIKERKLDTDIISDKEKALIAIARFIKTLQIVLDSEFELVEDHTKCSRAKVNFVVDLKDAEVQLKKINEKFDEVDYHRSKCIIHDFILKKFRSATFKYIDYKNANKKTRNTKAFYEISEKLEEIKNKSGSNLTCFMCQKIGDAVISLNYPKKMRLETIDYSFELLCDIIQKKYKRHPSTSQLYKQKP